MTEYPMHDWARLLWRHPRSLTGHGTRYSLASIKMALQDMEIVSVPSGTKAFDWIIPKEWSILDGYIADADGNRLIDYQENNLHVIGYSTPVTESGGSITISRSDLDQHLYSLPDKPDAIPYITSYYKERWGFCLSQKQRDALGDGPFTVEIESSLFDGVMNYGELIIPGDTDKEILLSTYICHPSMANDNLSGIVVTMALALWLKSLPSRRYTYRILFIPETIGSIYYLSRNIDEMRMKTVAGFVLSCCGDERRWTILPSRDGDTLADRAAYWALDSVPWEFMHFTDRGSDERQWCLAGLPVALVMRSGFANYPEYHTSLDDLTVITQKALTETLTVHQRMITAIENNHKWRAAQPCEPFLSAHGLYPDLSVAAAGPPDIIKVYGYCDGESDLFDIARLTKLDIISSIIPIIGKLAERGLIVRE